ncbi:teashirt homolog 3-like [Osmerus mordax]|uniref:teashirt homolog 3-like n=1 Tax=Osmerus mordax TaxID=8014 RepID=UPI00350EC35A
MPRRKQEAPKRAAAYSPEDLKEEEERSVEEEEVAGGDPDLEEGDVLETDDCSEDQDQVTVETRRDPDPLLRETGFDGDSVVAEPSGREMDRESHISEASDGLSDFDSSSVKAEEGVAQPGLNGGLQLEMTPLGPDTLEQMKAIYSSFLTNSYWSPLNFNLTQTLTPKPTPTQTQTQAQTQAQTLSLAAGEKPVRSSSTSSSCSSNSYDWHQSAVAKSLQHAPQARHPPSEPSLFSTVQLHRQNPRLFGSIFTGASKFRCKGCSAAYDTLVDLTVHMNDTGHYRDDNHDRAGAGSKRWSKPRKRSLLEMEGKEDAQKVLKCMYCGHSFESLQDLSVHMIKTKHYQKVPLKEPMAPLAARVTSSRKRATIGLDLSRIPRSREGTPKPKHPSSDSSDPSSKGSSQYTTPNHRYGHQNGASYAWQFESHKAQILKCMECGSSYGTLQELRAHMMVTGHYIRVTGSSGKRGRQAALETSPSPARVLTPSPARVLTPSPARVTSPTERVQSVPLAPSAYSPAPPSTSSPPATSSPLIKDIKKEEEEEECTTEPLGEETGDKRVTNGEEVDEKFDVSSKYSYLTEEDLKESPKGGLDILKSLENTVTSAINKAQGGNPSWGGGYPSIHAAYQLPNALKVPQGSTGTEKYSPFKYMFSGGEGLTGLSNPRPQQLVSPPPPQTSPLPQNNFQAMEELVRKVSEKVAKVERRVRQPLPSPKRDKEPRAQQPPPVSPPSGSEAADSPRADSPREPWRSVTPANSDRGSHGDRASPGEAKRQAGRSPGLSLGSSTAIITGLAPPEQPFLNPLSALQSIMNVHLGKAAKPHPSLPPLQDPLSLLSRLSQSMAERAAVAAPPLPTPTPARKPPQPESPVERGHCQPDGEDQPMDLTKGKSDRRGSVCSAPLTPSSTASSVSPSTHVTPVKMAVVSPFTSSSPLHENALSDISDMLRNLTQTHLVSKPPSRTRVLDRTDPLGSTMSDEAEGSLGHKRKGRQSNWNPQHLLLLQAQFASSLRQTSEGKFIFQDLSPQERMQVSRFTGLSMTTISHWLANVKYQLRRTGRTKFLKNLDSGHPVFYCSDCASQIRTPAAYICHLEAHMGFRLRDLGKLSPKQTLRDGKGTLSEKQPLEGFLPEPPAPEEAGNGTAYRCQLCVRKFASKHAIKLHLSKSHGKSPEDHLLYVCELDKH